MTREEAIKIIDNECKHIKHHLTEKGKAEEFYIELGNMVIAFNMAIKALEQEPCENAISSQAVLELVADYDLSMGQVVKGIHALSPVNPKPKTGHWITQWNVVHRKEYYYCSECREEFSYDGETGNKMNAYDFCPNCGCRMVDPQERSNKE